MKNICYFLLGVAIIFALLSPYAQAATCAYPSSITPMSGTNPNVTYHSEGPFDSDTSLNEALFLANWSYHHGEWYGDIYIKWYYASCGDNCVTYAAKLGSTAYTACAEDSDGDGIPDDKDLYPNDPDPFNVRLTSYQTIDGTTKGEHSRECYQTDKGDTYCVGADYDENKPNILVATSPWIPFEDSNTDQVGDGVVSDSNDGSAIEQRDHTTSQPTGDAAADTDSALKPGQEPTGSETDNQALQGIMSNTSSIADNTKRQGEYMHDLNAAIQSMDRNVSIQTANNENEDLERQQQKTEAESAENAFNSANVSDHYNTTNFSGELVEGSDYVPARELSEQSWFTDFFNSNPLKSAFDSSGFNLSNSSCTMTLSINGLGTHTLSLCEFDQEFQAAGDLLLGLTSLMALIIIAWR